jgi:Tfp pilus assembly protein PilX
MNTLLLSRGTARRQRGVSLIIAMMMLVVIGLVSVAVIRNATSADQAVNSNRLQTQASQYAQIALQFCENQLTVPPSSATVHIIRPAPATPAWKTKALWVDPVQANTPVFRLTSGQITGSVQPRVYPQCLVEQQSFNANVYVVTARGFSDDYTQDSNNATVSGSVVWLQSTVFL